MEKLILMIVGSIFLTSYNGHSNNTELEEINESELIVQMILDLEDLQWIYHSEVKGRLPVKILESELINKSLVLRKVDRKVRVLSLNEIEKEEVSDYLEFRKLIIKSDTAEFELIYKIEGVYVSGKFIKENGHWKTLDYKVVET